MKIVTSTDLTQKALIVRLSDTTVISGQTSFTLKIYTNPEMEATATYELSASELAYFLANKIVYLSTLAVFSIFPSDGYYYCKLEGSSITSDWDSVVFTLSIRGRVYAQLACINVYAPDYNISDNIHASKMLLDEMEAMQYLDYSTQKKVDFDFRLETLNQIL